MPIIECTCDYFSQKQMKQILSRQYI